MKGEHPFLPYRPREYAPEEMINRSREFYAEISSRRSLRAFSTRLVPEEAVLNAIATAASAPSGANKQPWTFCLVAEPGMKKRIRELAEEEEKAAYEGRMSDRWIKDLEPLGTNWEKPFLEEAPYLIVLFKRIFEHGAGGEKHNNYYVNESVGIAAGMLLAALQHAGICSLTHTPSPMNFLGEALGRPDNERAFLLIPVGYAAENAEVPDIQRKTADSYLVRY